MCSKILSQIIQWWYPLNGKRKEKTDIERSIPEIITSRGFKSETHEVTTEDGYILTLFRVVNPKNRARNIQAKPILLMHGFGGNASQFVVTSNDGYLMASEEENFSNTDNNLAFFLAKRGHDIWLGNMRGSRYCLKHKQGWKYPPDSDGFWNFSIDEIVKYDLPGCIDYILNNTGSATLGYVGVSLGTTVMFGLLSSQLKYNDLIQPFVSLAPCYRLYNMRSPFKYPLKYLANFWYKFPRLKPEFSLRYELALHRRTITNPVTNVISTHFCWWIMGILGGYNYEQFDISRMPVYAAHAASLWWPWKQLIHSTQYICRDIPFRKFDYGPDKNVQLYGMPEPPPYDISKITNRFMALFYSKNDWACSVQDVSFLKSQLKVPLLYDYLVSDENWCHYDFLIAKDCGKVIHPHIHKVIQLSSTNSNCRTDRESGDDFIIVSGISTTECHKLS